MNLDCFIIAKNYRVLKQHHMVACDKCGFYHSEKLQSTKTYSAPIITRVEFYHSEKLQSTKTSTTKLSTFVAFRYNKSINKKSTDHKTRAQNFTQKTLVICTTNSIYIYYC